jgi:hypothetical protein
MGRPVFHGALPQAVIGGEEIRVGADEGREVGTADLLLALDEELELEGELAVLLYVQAQRLYAGQHVALVVGDPTGVESPVPHRRLERLALPEIQGFGRLHVVVPVGQ